MCPVFAAFRPLKSRGAVGYRLSHLVWRKSQVASLLAPSFCVALGVDSGRFRELSVWCFRRNESLRSRGYVRVLCRRWNRGW